MYNTLIDNIFINNINPETKSGNLAVDTPDGHLPSFIITPRPNQNFLPKKHNKFVRDFNKLKYEEFIGEFNSNDWEAIIDSTRNDVNYSAVNFFDKFNLLLDKHAPVRKLTNKEYKHSFKPWIDSSVTTKIREKNKVLKKLGKCKDPIRKDHLTKQFKTIRNTTNRLIVAKKKEYFKNYFIRYKTNVKKVWKGIKGIINVKSEMNSGPNSIEIDGTVLTDPKLIAGSFNDYFTSIADSILEKRKYKGNKSFREFLINRITETFVFHEANYDEVQGLIFSLKENKSFGPNSIPVKILRLLGVRLVKPLTELFNVSIRKENILIYSKFQKLSQFTKKVHFCHLETIDQSLYFLT